MYFVKIAKKVQPAAALNIGIFSASAIMVILSFLVIKLIVNDMGIFYATIAGLVSGIIIGLVTEYYTSPERAPTRGVAQAARTGAATDIIQGLAVGMFSTVVPVSTRRFLQLRDYSLIPKLC